MGLFEKLARKKKEAVAQRSAPGDPHFADYIEFWNGLSSERTKSEAERLVTEQRYGELLAVLRDAKYPGRAQEALKRCGDSGTAKEVIALLQDGSRAMRCRAVSALGPLGGQHAAEELCRLLPEADYGVTGYIDDDEVATIAWALDDLRWDGAVPVLTAALRRATYFYHQVYLARALARSGGREGIEFLIAGIDNLIAGKSGIKIESVGLGEYCGALMKIDDPAAIPALQRSLSWLGSKGDLAEEIREFLGRHDAEPAADASTVAPDAPVRIGGIRCAVCGRDLSGSPAVRDNRTRALYCPDHGDRAGR